MTLYIKNWYTAFEYKHATRHSRVSWRRKPVTHESVRFRRLMESVSGCVAYCVFEAAVDLVARNRSEGVLVDAEGRQIGAREIALSAGIPVQRCRRGIALLKSKSIGWLAENDIRGPRPVDEKATDDGSTVDSDQIRSDRIRLDENLIRSDQAISSGRLTRPDQTDDIKAAVAAIEACGLSNTDALCIAANPKADMATLRHAALKTKAELDRGRLIKNARNYIEKIAGLRVTREDQVRARRVEIARDLGKARNGKGTA